MRPMGAIGSAFARVPSWAWIALAAVAALAATAVLVAIGIAWLVSYAD